MIRILLVLAAVASLIGGGLAWLYAFGAHMSDDVSAASAANAWPMAILLFGLPILSIALFVAAWWVGG